jgi:hypothetical protein
LNLKPDGCSGEVSFDLPQSLHVYAGIMKLNHDFLLLVFQFISLCDQSFDTIV